MVFLPSRRWSLGFLLIGVVTGPLLTLRVPSGHAPDERNHILRADSLLHGEIIGHRAAQNGKQIEGLLADAALSDVITLPPSPLNTSPQALTPVQKWLATKVPWNSKPSFVEAGSIAGYMPLFYLPGAAAIGLSSVAGLSPSIAFLADRIANLYCFLILGAVALRVARRGAGIIFITLLMPTTLALAASASQDGLLVAAAACAVACLTRAADSEQTHLKWRAAAAGLLAIVAASKPPYAPLALLLFLPLRLEPAHLLRRTGLVVLTILPAAAWTIFESAVANVGVPRTPAEAGPLWPGARPAIFDAPDPLAQMHVLLAHASLLVTLPLRTIAGNAGTFLQQAVGVLDYLCLYLPGWLYIIWYAALACTLAAHVCGGSSSTRQTIPDSLLAVTAILLSTVAVGLALYLDWTPVGMPWIGGLQGRYFLPFFPVLALCLPRLERPRLARFLIAPAVATAIISAAALPRIVLGFYPLR
jgi:uncharacterized membrane protein